MGFTKTCRKGHPWTEENTYRYPSSGHRSCRICRAAGVRKYAASHPEEKDKNKEYKRRNRDSIKQYMRNYKLQREYGISTADYTILFEKQGGCCKICDGKFEKLLVDHDHTSGKVRGLLCNYCNFFLGHIEARPGLPEACVAYLRGR